MRVPEDPRIEIVAKALFDADQAERSTWHNEVLYGEEGPVTWDFITSPLIVSQIADGFRRKALAVLVVLDANSDAVKTERRNGLDGQLEGHIGRGEGDPS